MAKKKTGPKAMPTTTPEPETKTKPVRLDLTPEVHQMLRVVAALHAKPMAVFAREVVEARVKELYKDKNKK